MVRIVMGLHVTVCRRSQQSRNESCGSFNFSSFLQEMPQTSERVMFGSAFLVFLQHSHSWFNQFSCSLRCRRPMSHLVVTPSDTLYLRNSRSGAGSSPRYIRPYIKLAINCPRDWLTGPELSESRHRLATSEMTRPTFAWHSEDSTLRQVAKGYSV